MKCDKCSEALLTVTIKCGACGRLYTRCQVHDGEKGAQRSFHAHKALVHTGQKVKTVRS